MDKETFNEMGQILIAAIISSIMLVTITGSVFLEKTRNAVNSTVTQSEQYRYQCDDAFEMVMTQN